MATDLRDHDLDIKHPIRPCWLRAEHISLPVGISAAGIQRMKLHAPLFEIIAQRSKFLDRILPHHRLITPNDDGKGNLFFDALVEEFDPHLKDVTIYGYPLKQTVCVNQDD